MDIVEIFFMFPFIIYAICCLAITFYGYAAGYGERGSFDIETTLFFIVLITPSLIVYAIIKLLIDTFQNFKVWKILNFIFLCVFMYAFFAKLEAIQVGYIFDIPCFDESHKIISCLELANEK